MLLLKLVDKNITDENLYLQVNVQKFQDSMKITVIEKSNNLVTASLFILSSLYENKQTNDFF